MSDPKLDDDSIILLVKTINGIIESAQNCLITEVNNEAEGDDCADAPTISINDINDNCLQCVLKRLPDVCSLMQAAHVNKRFEKAAKNVCRLSGYFRVLRLEVWEYALPKPGDINYFLQLIRSEIREVKITDRLNVFLQLFTEVNRVKTLPLVRSCDLMEFDDFPHGSDLLALRLHFPKLESLRIVAPITGHYINHFENLQELLLYDDYEKDFELKDEYFYEICTQLKNLRVLDVRYYGISRLNATPVFRCLTLQELRINLNALKRVLNGVIVLPKLRILNVKLDRKIIGENEDPETFDQRIFETSEFLEILRRKAASIIGLAIDFHFFVLNESWDWKNTKFLSHKKLRWLAFCGCDFNPGFLNKYTNMADLEFMCLRNWRSLTNSVVIQFVGYCLRLTEIDLSFCLGINWQLLSGLLRMFKQIHRTRPLHIYYNGSGLVDELEGAHKDIWLANKYLIFHKSHPKGESGYSYVDHGFEFEFDVPPDPKTQ